MLELLGHFKQGGAEQPAWEGRTGAHYIFIGNPNSLRFVKYEVVSCGIEEAPTRRGQYFEFQPKGSDVPSSHLPQPQSIYETHFGQKENDNENFLE